MAACQNETVENVKLLLVKGADVNSYNSKRDFF